MSIYRIAGGTRGVIEVEGDITEAQAAVIQSYFEGDGLPQPAMAGWWTPISDGLVVRFRAETRYFVDAHQHRHVEGLLHWVEEPPGEYPEAGIATTAHLAFGDGPTECGLNPRGWFQQVIGEATGDPCHDCKTIIATELGLETR